MAASCTVAPWRTLPPTPPCSSGCSASAWIPTNERARNRYRRRRRAAENAARCRAAAVAVGAGGGRVSVHPVEFDLADLDHSGPRDGHDDLRDGVRPDAD